MNLLNLLPSTLRQKVERSPDLVKIFDNVGWQLIDKIVRVGLGLLVGVWLARYLGPEQFGQLNYAIAFVALFGTFAGLGLSGIVVRDIVREPETARTTLGTAIILQILGSVISIVLMAAAIKYLRPDDVLTRTMVAILGLGLVFKSTEVIKYWFESQIQVRYSIWIENGAFLIMTSVRITLILQDASLMAFVWVTLVEAAAIAVGLLASYSRFGGHIAEWRYGMQRARTLLIDSWPLLLSGLAIFLFMRVDQLMLGLLASDREVGVYAAALRLSEPWYFLPGVIASSVFPLIVRRSSDNTEHYEREVGRILRIAVWAHIAISIAITLGSDFIVESLFSDRYRESASMLRIHVWTGVFQAMGIISGQWMIYEGLLTLALFRNICGAFVSIVLNTVLIPLYGGIGAAVSVLISVIVAYYLFDLYSPSTRRMFWLKTHALWSRYPIALPAQDDSNQISK